MSAEIKSVDDLQEYLLGVMGRVGHHAPEVHDASIILVGLIVLYKDTDSIIKVRTYAGQKANMLWVTINKKGYAFKYNHEDHTIEIRAGTLNGPLLETVSDLNSCKQLRAVLENLKNGYQRADKKSK